MKYSQSTELAIDSLFYMAAHLDRHDFAVDEVAQAQRVSPSYLAKVFQQLSKAGLLKSHRGAKGGYQLAKPSADITLLDIALVFEGSSPMYDCNASSKNCTLGPKCLIVSTFREAERQMHDVLQSVSLEKLVENWRRNSRQAEWVGAPVAAQA